ncbi:MAG: putative lipid II flippase FtsW [Anaeromyxobacter sp.]
MSGESEARREAGGPPFDVVLLGAILALVAVGLVFVYSASAVQAGRAGNQFTYLWRQLLAAGIGLGLMGGALWLGTDRIARLAYPLMLAALVLLALVPFIGSTAGGAQRWIPLGPLHLQPAEVAKVAMVLYLARSLARKGEQVRTFSVGLLPHLIVLGVLVALCQAQRDMGTGVVLFLVSMAVLFAAGARVGYLFLAGLLAAPVAYLLIRSNPYRMERIIAFMHPEDYRGTTGFQLWESLLGTANGGWLGQGLGQSKGKLDFLPAAHTDFIAAVIAEEAGLIGVVLLVLLFGVVLWRGVRATLRAQDAFSCHAALGVTTLIGLQALVNLCVVFGLMPTKGLTLPFVSYGGSSLLTLLGASGVLLAVSAQRGGHLTRAPAAVRVGAPIGSTPRLAGPQPEEAP